MRFAAYCLVSFVFPICAEEPRSYPPPAKVRADLLKLLDRPKVEPDVKADKATMTPDGFVLEHFTFASQKKPDGTIERVPMLILKPADAKGRLPAVIVMHGIGGNMHGMIPIMKQLARKNIIGVAIDARYHGERSGGLKGSEAVNEALVRAWKTKPGEPMEYPNMYDTVWDVWRTIDLLLARNDIDAHRLGMFGISMGGMETWLAAGVDERIKVAVTEISIKCNRWNLDNGHIADRMTHIRAVHEAAAKDLGEPRVNVKVCEAVSNKINPGILDEFDCPSMLRLLAGRPLFITGGTKDPSMVYGGAQVAIESAKRAFAAVHADDKIDTLYFDVGHTVTPKMVEAGIEWLDRWLPHAAEGERTDPAARHVQSDAIKEFRKTAIPVTYPSGDLKLHGWIYRPKGDVPFPAVIWNHGSEKQPAAHPELGKFFTDHGCVLFVPVRRGHGQSPGDYIGDVLDEFAKKHKGDREAIWKKAVELHETYNSDVVAALDWLKEQDYVDKDHIAITGLSYGGIQTLLAAEKKLGIRACVAFAPGAMSWANLELRKREAEAVRNATVPIFLIQAKNDYSTGPSELLGPMLREKPAPNRAKLYPEFGATHAEGHGGFGCWEEGINIWSKDVVEFLNAAGMKLK
jgi:dienelactone hydrolase